MPPERLPTYVPINTFSISTGWSATRIRSPIIAAARALGVAPSELLVFEDTPTGVAAAKAAGSYVVALTGTLGAERLREADELVTHIDRALVERLLCS